MKPLAHQFHGQRNGEAQLDLIVGFAELGRQRLLPALARETLSQVVLEVVMPMAEKLADTPITLVLNPAVRVAVEALLEQATGLPLIVTEEPSLSEGQVYLKFGDTETQINLDRATAEITAAVRGFFDIPEQEKKYG